jgi:hypothetical protein
VVAVIQYGRDIKGQDASCIFCIADVDIENHAMMLAYALKGKVKGDSQKQKMDFTSNGGCGDHMAAEELEKATR